jgi:RNA recognition motif-containing protein
VFRQKKLKSPEYDRMSERLPCLTKPHQFSIKPRISLKILSKIFFRSVVMSSMKLYVGNLSYNTSETDLKDLFAAYGEVESTRIIMDRDTGRSKGFGFVEMTNRADGEKAIAQLNGKDVDSRQVKVNEAKPQTDRGSGGGGGGFGGGRGGGGGGRGRY